MRRIASPVWVGATEQSVPIHILGSPSGTKRRRELTDGFNRTLPPARHRPTYRRQCPTHGAGFQPFGTFPVTTWAAGQAGMCRAVGAGRPFMKRKARRGIRFGMDFLAAMGRATGAEAVPPLSWIGLGAGPLGGARLRRA